jgi:hypothetical protein
LNSEPQGLSRGRSRQKGPVAGCRTIVHPDASDKPDRIQEQGGRRINIFAKFCVSSLILASGSALTSAALAEYTSDSEECNIYFKIDNETDQQVDRRILKKSNADNIDIPVVPPSRSDTVACYWLEDQNRKSSVEVSYAASATGYFVITYVAEYENNQISQDAIVTRDGGSDITATYDGASTTVTIKDAN